MNKNILVILLTSSIFSICFGLYDFVLPLYLESEKISYVSMGIIFSISAIFIFFFRVYVGRKSDIIGRKPFYSMSLILSFVGNFFTPLFSNMVVLSILKSIRESGAVVRENIRTLLVYENAKEKFTSQIGKVTGLEWFCQGIGTLLAGVLVIYLGNKIPFYLSGILLFITYLYFKYNYVEKENINNNYKKEKINFKDIFSFKLHPKLKIIMFSSFIFHVGVSCSHSFIMPLFFLQKFNLTPASVSVILMLHRFSLGIPMYIFSGMIKGNLKLIYILTVAYQGISIFLSGIIPNFLLATIFWLSHDVTGAAFWVPVQQTLIQKYSKDETRGKDLSEVTGFGFLGQIIGPIITGLLAGISISLPFIVSGIIIILAALILIKI